MILEVSDKNVSLRIESNVTRKSERRLERLDAFTTTTAYTIARKTSQISVAVDAQNDVVVRVCKQDAAVTIDYEAFRHREIDFSRRRTFVW